jgi:hypothetical protein
VNLLALDLGAITDTIDIEYPVKALADTFGHVGDQFPGKTVQSSNSPHLFAALNMDNRSINFNRDSGWNRGAQLSFGPF